MPAERQAGEPATRRWTGPREYGFCPGHQPRHNASALHPLNPQKMTPTKLRYDFLDGIRGLAAIAVMLFHFEVFDVVHVMEDTMRLMSGPKAGPAPWHWLGGGWIAVDLFFVLSGFVIAHSYSGKIIEGMSFRAFAKARLLRLAPVYCLGLLFGLVAAILTLKFGPESLVKPFHVLTAVVFGLFVLPYVNRYSWPMGFVTLEKPVFPLNNPSWSMFFELFVNLVFFVYLHKLKRLPGKWLVAVFMILFALATWRYTTGNVGWSAENFLYGFPRVMAGFFLGVLIYAWHPRDKTCPWYIPFALVLGVFAVAAIDHWLAHLLGSLVLAPLAILTGAMVKVEGGAKGICAQLGEISYPLYLLHLPLYQLAFLLIDFRGVERMVPGIIVGIVALLIAALAGSVDRRLRARIALRRDRSAVEASPAG